MILLWHLYLHFSPQPVLMVRGLFNLPDLATYIRLLFLFSVLTLAFQLDSSACFCLTLIAIIICTNITYKSVNDGKFNIVNHYIIMHSAVIINNYESVDLWTISCVRSSFLLLPDCFLLHTSLISVSTVLRLASLSA